MSLVRLFSASSRAAFVAASSVGLVLLAAAPATAQDFTGFRGATGSGVVAAAIDEGNLNPVVTWRADIGIGYSGVAVADGRAITMFEDDEQVMVAFDAETGEELWRRRVGDPYPGRDGSWNGPIATPAVSGNIVAALEPWGNLVALDTTDGEPVWSVHLTDDLGAPRPLYGFASSPVIVGDVLVVHGGAEAGSILAFNVRTGEKLWAVGTEQVDAQSPVALTLAGANMVVAAGEEHLFGIDVTTGEIAWEYAHSGDGFRGVGSLVPVAVGDEQIFLAHSDNASQLVGITEGPEGMLAEQVWQDRTIRNSYTVAVHHEGYIYAYSTRILVCVDAATGALQWRSRQPGDGFITLVGDKMVIMTKDGSLHIARATPAGYEELTSTVVFDELTWTPVSFANGAVFARSLDQIVRVDMSGTTEADYAVADRRFNVPVSLPLDGTEFGAFVAGLETAADPAAAIDELFEAHPQMPLIEGDRRVHFLYRGDDEVMSIAGDFVGSRQEAPMERVGSTDLFYYSTEIDPAARVSYVFMRETETITDPRNPDVEGTTIFDADRELSFAGPVLPVSELHMPAWERPAHLREPSGARGSIEAVSVVSEVLGEFAYQVYLPHGYGDGEQRYPVVYFQTRAPGDLALIPRSLDNLIADGMEPVIAVYSEAFLPPAPPYIQMWAEQLVPEIDGRYRTIATADGRVSIGGALGSQVAMFAAFMYPELTAGVAVQTPVFLDTDWDNLSQFLVPASERPLRIYWDWGLYDVQNPQEAWDGRAMAAEQKRRLEAMGFDVVGGEVPDGTGWVSWRNRTGAAIRAVLSQ